MATARNRALFVLAVAAFVVQAFRPAVAQSPTYGVGRTPKPEELMAIDIDVTPDGEGLPPGSSTAAAGNDVYRRRCETCHGPTGTEGPQDILAGGQGSLATSRPLKTVGSYWPYATTLWDYIRRAMPFDHPGTLTAEEIYGTTAYLLFLNGIVGERDVVDQATLPQIKMPNRDGFTADPRPDIGAKPTATQKSERAPKKRD
jgi:S-disulfanyl-L-cysteine oxidoreductase SoxD